MNSYYLYNVEQEDSSLQTYYYENMKTKLNSIVYRLEKSLSYLDNVDNSYKNGYSIDEYNSNMFEEVRNEISGRINYIKYTVIPAIKEKIDSLA